MTLPPLMFLVVVLLTLDTLIVGVAVLLLLRFFARARAAVVAVRASRSSDWADDPRLRR